MINRLKQIVEQYPDNIAIEDHTVKDRTVEQSCLKITYQQLWCEAFIIANELIHCGCKPQDKVLLHYSQSSEFIIAQIACWIVGAVFVPCNISLPVQRKTLILKNSQAKLILTSETNPVDFVFDELGEIVSISTKQTLLEKTSKHKINSHKINNNQQSDLAYIIFTSGSTGNAKGVMVNHEALPLVLMQQIKQFSVVSSDRCLWLHDLGFDAAISDIWVALLSGATLVIPSFIQAQDVLTTINELQIHYVDLPAALLPLIHVTDAPEALKTIVIGGEVCDKQALISWAEAKDVFIVYGPTETTICSSIIKVDAKVWQYNEIGKPLPHVNYFIVDENLNLVKPGVIGELIITGKGIARGYLLGEQSFRFFDFKQKRAYRTGDLVREIAEQHYEFIGRVDRQFKLNGKLICPEEIELKLKDYIDVNESFVFKKESELLVAISLLTKNNQEITKEKLKQYLKKYLPQWMVPTQWLFYEKLPRNHHHKIDPEKIYCQTTTKVQYNSWLAFVEKIIKQPVSSLKVSLYDLGINSMQVIKIVHYARSLGLELSAEDLYYSNDIFNLLHNLTIKPKSTVELLSLIENIPAIKFSNHNNNSGNAIFITGATGNLGKKVLSQLVLKQRTIYCLVRGNSNRIKSHENLVVLSGDITLPKFGLSGSSWNDLCDQVSDIYHCAADVSLLKNIHQLFKPNVLGCYHVLQLLASGQKKKLHYASTLSLVVDSDLKYQSINEDNSLSNIKLLYGGYAQSKWLSEQLIHSYVKANIFRFGLLTSSLNDNDVLSDDWFNKSIKQCPDLSGLSEQCTIDFTPIDYAAKAMVCLSLHQYGNNFHINNPKPLNVKRLKNSLSRYPLGEKLIEKQTDPWRLFKMTNTQIDNQKTIEILEQLKIIFPRINQAYVNQYVDCLLKEKSF
ncbi:non-ribosomal peptide synthetase [Aliikangiella sp. IMCC44359]|uniref:non-ribosomal peptide synthetase n=1 Tax=Aliikangiella sp. IMCC44359 TaxID=3459125 RepID=UPI00403AD6ED